MMVMMLVIMTMMVMVVIVITMVHLSGEHLEFKLRIDRGSRPFVEWNFLVMMVS